MFLRSLNLQGGGDTAALALMNRWKPLLAGLACVTLIALVCVWRRAYSIQTSIHERATASLQAAGIPPSPIAVSGRTVILTGFNGAREVSPDAQAAVRGTGYCGGDGILSGAGFSGDFVGDVRVRFHAFATRRVTTGRTLCG